MPDASLDQQHAPRVWLRAFWGFDPEEAGYLGFTKKGNRDRFIAEWQPGDLVLIYGADQVQTAKEQRRQLLGFLEIEPTPIRDVERCSERALRRKTENGWETRWTHAVPVKRAWRITRKVNAQHFAAATFRAKNPILIASRAELLTPDEAQKALALPVQPASVFGEEPLPLESIAHEAAVRELFKPSQGVTPSFGTRTVETEDGENRLYILRLEGNVAAFLNRPKFEVARKIVVKIGHAKEPNQRCATHNAHLPPACAFKWKVGLQSQPFRGGVEAKLAEDQLKRRFAERFVSLGGEFFLADETSVALEFSDAARSTSFVISTVS